MSQHPTALLHPEDDVLIALRAFPAGSEVDGLTLTQDVGVGHKIARRAVAKGAPVHRYHQVIGFASTDIAAGEHVHSHNLGMGEFERDYGIGQDVHAFNHFCTGCITE